MRLDLKAMQIRRELSQFIKVAIADSETVDEGGGMGSEDIWFSVDGVKFHVTIGWPKDATP